jgi:hypothetical protein
MHKLALIHSPLWRWPDLKQADLPKDIQHETFTLRSSITAGTFRHSRSGFPSASANPASRPNDIGGYPPPQVIYREPRVLYRTAMSRPPIYLHVPPGHAKNWRKHCREYNACGERVYFVQNSWYSREYVPRYQKQHRDRRDDHRAKQNDRHGNDRGQGRGH